MKDRLVDHGLRHRLRKRLDELDALPDSSPEHTKFVDYLDGLKSDDTVAVEFFRGLAVFGSDIEKSRQLLSSVANSQDEEFSAFADDLLKRLAGEKRGGNHKNSGHSHSELCSLVGAIGLFCERAFPLGEDFMRSLMEVVGMCLLRLEADNSGTESVAQLSRSVETVCLAAVKTAMRIGATRELLAALLPLARFASESPAANLTHLIEIREALNRAAAGSAAPETLLAIRTMFDSRIVGWEA